MGRLAGDTSKRSGMILEQPSLVRIGVGLDRVPPVSCSSRGARQGRPPPRADAGGGAAVPLLLLLGQSATAVDRAVTFSTFHFHYLVTSYCLPTISNNPQLVRSDFGLIPKGLKDLAVVDSSESQPTARSRAVGL
eukprot:gene13315-biopygen12091